MPVSNKQFARWFASNKIHTKCQLVQRNDAVSIVAK
jgi:hypothetical protein